MALRIDNTAENLNFAGNPTGDFTLFYRFRAAVVNRTYDVHWYMGNNVASTYQDGFMIMFGDFGDRIEVWGRSTAFRFQQSAGQALSAATWYDLILTGNTGTSQNCQVRIFPHGSTSDRGGSFTSGAAGTMGTVNFMLGNDPTGDAAEQTRLMDARIWNAQLTEAEISAERYQQFARRRRDLWGAWTLRNDSFGLTDYSGNGRNLTETGTAVEEDGAPGIPWSIARPVYYGRTSGGGGAVTVRNLLMLGVG